MFLFFSLYLVDIRCLVNRSNAVYFCRDGVKGMEAYRHHEHDLVVVVSTVFVLSML